MLEKLSQAEEALLDALKGRVHPLNSACKITLVNRTPLEWNVKIAAAGLRFIFADEGGYTDGPRGVELRSGDTAAFTSNKPSGCVSAYVLALSAEIPGEGIKNYTYPYAEEPGMCVTHHTVSLGPISALSEEDIKKIGLSTRLELRHMR
jgi:hypothetical protein